MGQLAVGLGKLEQSVQRVPAPGPRRGFVLLAMPRREEWGVGFVGLGLPKYPECVEPLRLKSDKGSRA